MREIVLDTETTGLDYKAGDRIIEIGCVELINYVPTGSYLQFYCKTNKEISPVLTILISLLLKSTQIAPNRFGNSES